MAKNEMSIRDLQIEIGYWNRQQFGDGEENRYRTLLGIGEEVGELMHVHLKQEQGIRGYTDPYKAQADKYDALGDIFIYMCAYAERHGIDLQLAIEQTWISVRERKWKENPADGS